MRPPAKHAAPKPVQHLAPDVAETAGMTVPVLPPERSYRLRRMRLWLRSPPPWRRFRYRRQRARRGWSDRDVYGLCAYLAEVIAGTVTQLRTTTHSYPLGMTAEEWDGILTRVAGPLSTYGSWDHLVDEETWEEQVARVTAAQDKVRDALRLLADHFNDLWD